MAPGKYENPPEGDSPIGKKGTPLSSRSTQEQGPEKPISSTSVKEHKNPVMRRVASMELWTLVIVIIVGVGLAVLVYLALL